MKKYILGIVAVALIITVSAFSITVKRQNIKTVTPTVWFYNAAGTTLADFQDGTNWSQTNSGSCVSSGQRPCQISADAPTQSELTSYLSHFDKNGILNMSSGRKP